MTVHKIAEPGIATTSCWLLAGGLAIAVGDMIFATTLWFGWTGAGLVRLFQTIAVGVLGQDSYQGGMASAWLGAGLHLFIATAFVLVYARVAYKLPTLLRRPYYHGALYGIVLYLVMSFVVLPLSRVGKTPSLQHVDWIVYSVLAHMLFGVFCVLFARRALRR